MDLNIGSLLSSLCSASRQNLLPFGTNNVRSAPVDSRAKFSLHTNPAGGNLCGGRPEPTKNVGSSPVQLREIMNVSCRGRRLPPKRPQFLTAMLANEFSWHLTSVANGVGSKNAPVLHLSSVFVDLSFQNRSAMQIVPSLGLGGFLKFMGSRNVLCTIAIWPKFPRR